MPKSKTVLIARSGRSKSIKLFVTISRLPMTAQIPIISKIFAIFEPITFAATTSGTPLNIATKEEISSGKDVPTPTIVTPTIKGDKPRDSLIFSALAINQSAPFISTPNETINTIIQIMIINVVVKIYKKFSFQKNSNPSLRRINFTMRIKTL